jgi:hypothetical protein
MKKVTLFSILVLVCTAVMTNCGDDDKSVSLTGLNVAPKTIKLQVGGEQKITVTTVPADATDAVTYTWTSQNTSIATVDANGLVKIVGVGSTTVTVSGGTGISADITVEGTLNSLTVTDENGSISGTYAYNGQLITFTLTATLVPPASGLKPTWTSSATNATVEAAADGLTAVVTLTGEGAVVITAAVGDVSGTYAISTTSIFESAYGYWTFDDPANLGKATRGSDLTVHSVEVVPGPSSTKGAVRMKDRNKALEWEHNLPVRDYTYTHIWGDYEYKATDVITLLFDVDAGPLWEVGEANGFERCAAPLYWNDRSEESSFVMRYYNDNTMNVYANGNRWNFGENQKRGWYRVVIKIWPVREGEESQGPEGTEPDISFHREVWVDGTLISDIIRPDNSYFRAAFVEDAKVWFLSASEVEIEGGDLKQNNSTPCSTIAVWDRLLTADEIVQLGGVSK